ncbi:MAG: hypothetical protein ACK5JG_10315 [Pseudomonadota bacterium]
MAMKITGWLTCRGRLTARLLPLGLAGVLLLLVGCARNDDEAPAADGAASATIGPAGGTLNGPDGAQLIVPPGALDRDVTLRIARSRAGAPDGPPDLPADLPVYELTPHDLAFNLPVQLRLPLGTPAQADAGVMVSSPTEPWTLAEARFEGSTAILERLSLSWYSPFWTFSPLCQPRPNDPNPCALVGVGPGVVTTTPPGLLRPPLSNPTITGTGPLNIPINYGGPRDCVNPRLRIERWNWGPPALMPASQTRRLLFDGPVPAMTPSPTATNRAGGTFQFQTPVDSSLASSSWVLYRIQFNCTRSFDGTRRGVFGELTYGIDIPPPQAPTISTQPSDQSVTEGQSASFSVAASAAPNTTLLYQWSRRANPSAAFAPIAGATAAAYTTPATTLADGLAQFRVEVCASANLCVTSDVATLTVAAAPAAPSFGTQPTDASVVAGQRATFDVQASGLPPPSITWQTAPASDPGNFVGLVANDCPVIGPPARGVVTVARCTTDALTLADNGRRYRAVATSSAGTTTSNVVTVTVTPAPVPPAITQPPTLVLCPVGGSASFSAAASGSPAPTLGWSINGSALAVGPFSAGSCSGSASFGASGGTLTLSGLSAGCNGATVGVTASNGTPPSASASATLTVTPTTAPAPTITSFTSNGPRDEGQTVTTTVTATGSNLTYQWLLSFDIGSTGIAIAGATSASYATPPMTQGYNAAALRVRVCSGPQPADIADDPRCTFSNIETPLGQTFEVGAAGVCYGGPNGWCVRSPSPQPNDLRALVLPDPSNSPTAPVVAVGFGTVISSTDFGVSWTTRFPNPRLDFRGLARVADGSRLVAAVAANNASQTTGGLYTSDDGGATWALATGVGTQDFVSDVALATSGSGVAVGSGLWRSAANGTGWTPVVTGAQFLPESLTRVVIQGNVALAVSDAGGILRSTDGGVNWTRVYSDNGARRLVDAALDAFGLAVVVIDNANQVLVSSDAGQSWSLRTLPFGNARGVGLRAQDQAVVLSATGDGAFSTDGGQTWTLATAAAGISGDADWRIAYTSSGNGLAVGKVGAQRRTNSRDRFYGIGGGDADARIDAIEAAPDGTLLMVRGGRIGRSTDNGSTWTGFGQPGTSLSWVGNGTAFAALLSGNATKLFRSDDAGQTFTEQWDQSNDMIYGLSMINTSVGVLIGTRGGQPAVFRTTNGRFWDSIGALPAGFEPRSVLALNPGPFADPNSAVVLVGSGDGRVLRTTNGGLSWFELNPGIGAAVNQIRRIDASGVIAAADNGLWQSLDAGQNWTRVFDSTPYGSMTSVAVDASGRCVATGVVGVVDCSSFSIIDLPFNGLLRATAWGSGDTVLAGGLGGALLINRNGGLPARAAPDRRQRLGTTRTASYPMPLARVAAPPTPRGALRPATAPTAAAARPAAPALRDPRDPRAVLLPRTVPNARKATLPPLPPVVVGPLRRHVDVVPAGRPDAAGVRQR